ncbi:MAG: hypothetical protein GY926_06705 [bacterium]|nr:hypothetical protein [bacterium]
MNNNDPSRCNVDATNNPHRTTTLRAVGFNPFRQQENRTADLAIAIPFTVNTMVVALWAVFG